MSFSAVKLSVKHGSSLTEPTLRGEYKGSGAGAVSYTSNNTAVATVDSGTGKVTGKEQRFGKDNGDSGQDLNAFGGCGELRFGGKRQDGGKFGF